MLSFLLNLLYLLPHTDTTFRPQPTPSEVGAMKATPSKKHNKNKIKSNIKTLILAL